MSSFIPGIGLSVVYEPENSVPAVDIVFVHGLGGHPYRTWTHTNVPKTLGGDHDGQPSPVFWPRDLLPADLPNSRILVYGYDIKVTELVTSNPLKSHIFSDSQDLLFALQKARVLNRPRIFIAHDFGGLIIKELLVRCAESEHEDIIRSTVAVIFFGTPHQGDSADLGRLVASIWQPTPSDLRQDSYGAILAVLGLTGTSLERQKEAFYRIWRKYDFRVKTFIEGLSPITSATKVPPDYCALIGDHRERPEIIEADHTGMCRFPGADDIKYRMVAGEILSIYRSITKSNAENVHQSGRIQNPMLGNISIAKIHEVVGADDHLKDDDEACIRSLWFPTMDSGRLNKQKPADRTCLWLFDHEIYQDWFSGRKRDSHNGLLWLKGKPGAGKSTLMMEAFRHTAEMEEVQSAAFFFDAKGPELNHSPVGLFRSLLYQLLPRYQEHLRQLNRVLHQRDLDWGKHEAKASSWQEKELESFFSSFALQLARPTFIFIDALDECDSKSIRKQAYFWRYITASAYRAGVQLNVCVSSSHLPFISLSNCPEIVVEQFNSRDIATFVELKLMVCTALARAERGALRDAVLGRAVGVFLWAVLVVDDLLSKFDEGYSIPQLLNQLDIVPLELETLFSSMFHSVNSEERLLTVRLFQWAVLAAKPLRLFEWHHIMAFIRQPAPSSLAEWHLSDSFTTNDDQLEKQIRYISKGLVEVKTLGDPQDWYSDTMSMDASAGSVNSVHGESRVVQVIHGSVREFFLHGSGFSVIDPSLGPHPVGKGHLSIIATCLDYINIRELDRFFEARVMAGRPGNDQRSSNEHRTSGTQSPGPQNIETHPFSLTQHDGTRKQGEGRAWEGEQPKGNMTKENLEKRKGYADAASRIDTIRQWALDTEQTSLDESARSSTTDLSITGWFEAFPALLSYATSQLFTHARLAADAGVDPRLIFSLFTEKTWERWVALSDDVPPGTQLVDYAADQGLSAWHHQPLTRGSTRRGLRPPLNQGTTTMTLRILPSYHPLTTICIEILC
ncbi:hypothetical protein QBC43DRAFT_340361 [Cladorrhinum sp. PSN259]|nr:hypothetical protein QBC43DRAFT_340361 [Cladorrhinum sp. PSN259]